MKIFSRAMLVTPAVCLLFQISYSQTVTIDASVEHQLIRGYGGMNHTSWIADLDENVRTKAFENAPGNLGLSILRVHIDPDANRFNEQVATAKFASDRGALVFASPWDPPSSMIETVNNMKKLRYDRYGAYVDHLNQFDQFMSENEVPLYGISIQNEPDYGDWTRWTSAEMVTFLKENGADINNRVIAPESFQFRREFTDPLLQDDLAAENIDIVGGHVYGGGNFDYPLAREKGKEVWMTEHYTTSDRSANLWPDALLVGQDINDCMTANFNAYVWWYIRRFYGLITDDGLLSKRGYVLSHYSKFVRPGNTRIESIVSGVSNLHVTAYKSDTSLVMVILNRNSSEVTAGFTIQNTTIDSLVKFVTTSEKDVYNEGGISIASNAFTATFEGNSITTLTTHPENGMKFGNEFPVADAGGDVNVNDEEGDGYEVISLDASGSSDPDGAITELTWSLNGDLISYDAIHDVEFPIGEHTVVLTVVDNDGAISRDTISVVVNSTFETELWFEAECSEVGSTWQILEDNDASNGKFISTPAGTESVESPSAEEADIIRIKFETTEASRYKVWARVITPSPNDDSFWVNMDGNGTWTLWNSIPSSNVWHWDDVHDQSNENPVFYDLAAGLHELTICFREDGALLDKILISNTGITPTGVGGEAQTCLQSGTRSSVEQSMPLFYPNPVFDVIHFDPHINDDATMVIYDAAGLAHSVKISGGKADVSSLKSGFYLIRITGGDAVRTGRFIKL